MVRLLEAALHRVEVESHYAVTLRLTLILVLLHGAASVLIEVPVRVLCGVLLVFPAALRAAHLWWILGIVVLLGNGVFWYSIDNHKYLIAYWTLACAMSLSVGNGVNRTEYLRRTARYLVGFVFAFATAWKMFGGEYFDGSFLYFTFLTDPRLWQATSLIAGLPVDDLRLVGEAVQFASFVPLVGTNLPLPRSDELYLFTLALSWLTLVGEGAVAATHLWSARGVYVVRHTVLMFFVGLTYFLLPVVGFAFILTILGFAECEDDDRTGKLTYLLLLVVINMTLIEWQPLLRVLVELIR